MTGCVGLPQEGQQTLHSRKNIEVRRAFVITRQFLKHNLNASLLMGKALFYCSPFLSNGSPMYNIREDKILIPPLIMHSHFLIRERSRTQVSVLERWRAFPVPWEYYRGILWAFLHAHQRSGTFTSVQALSRAFQYAGERVQKLTTHFTRYVLLSNVYLLWKGERTSCFRQIVKMGEALRNCSPFSPKALLRVSDKIIVWFPCDMPLMWDC